MLVPRSNDPKRDSELKRIKEEKAAEAAGKKVVGEKSDGSGSKK